MIQFLEDLKGKGTAPISAEQREELERLRKEHAKLRIKAAKSKVAEKGDNSDGSDESSEVNAIVIMSYIG